MDLNRYMSVLRMMLLAMNELDHETSLKTFIRLTIQYGSCINITANEVLEVLETKPIDKLIIRRDHG